MVAQYRRRLGVLAAGIAALWALSGRPDAAVAQDAAASDPFEQGVVYLEADEVVDDQENGRYVARGDVEARYGSRTVRADEVIYFPETQRVIARGDVAVIDDTGLATFADEIELSADLTQGVAEDFSVRLPNNAAIGAAFALRRDETRSEFRRAFYTACTECEEDRAPTWRLRARRVTRDTDEEMIFYRDVVLEVRGVPVLYSPFFAHADPSTPRRSGFLLPTFAESTASGTSYEQPYFWAISDHSDLTLSPRIISRVNPLMNFEARHRFFSGYATFQGSITHEQEFDEDGERFGDETWRSHVFGEGAFRISENWIWGFGVERVTDDLYLERYQIDDSDQNRGLYARGSKRLLSQAFAVGQGENFFATIAALDFQGLRAGDVDGAIPSVAPLIEARRMFDDPLFGGRIEARASTAFLSRDDGPDSRRMTVEADWRRPTILSNGLVATPFALARADIYDVRDYTTDGGADVNETFTRGLGYVGLDMSYPFGRQAGPVDIIIEPVASFVYAPEGGDDERIPNEDSVALDFDESALLEPNRAPGYDQWEDGARVTVGGRALAQWGRGGEASVFLGQVYRADDLETFDEVSGLSGDVSDVVGAARFALNPETGVTARFRLDDDDWDILRFDLDARAAVGPLSVSGRYLNFEEELTSDRPRETVSLRSSLDFADNWAAFYSLNRDLEADENRLSTLGLIYNDDCTRVTLVYKREETADRAIGPGESIRLQFTLATLGTFGRR